MLGATAKTDSLRAPPTKWNLIAGSAGKDSKRSSLRLVQVGGQPLGCKHAVRCEATVDKNLY